MGGFELSQIVYILTGLGGIAAVASFVIPLMRRRKRADRIEAVVSKRRGELSRQQMDSLSQAGRQRKAKLPAHVEMAQKLVERLKLEGMVSQEKVKTFLAQGGFRNKSALAVYAMSRFFGIFAGIVAGIILVNMGLKEKDLPFIVHMALWGVGGIVGFYLPKILVQNKAQKRQAEMNKGFPDALDLMVICVEAGLTVEGAFDRVTNEMSENAPTLAQELGLATAELAYLGDRAKAYQNFANRTGLPAARSLATTLIQTERYGTPVSVAIKVLAQERRQERMAAAEKKAAALPAQLTVPMIIFFLPVLFLVVIGPAVIQVTSR